MAFLYVPPPAPMSVNHVAEMFATWISRLYRCKVSISVDHLNGEHFTVVIANPDKE